MKETDFTKELVKTFKKQYPKSWIYPIPNMPKFGSFSKFIPPKPADIIAQIEGHSILIECKQIRKWQPFGIKEIRDTQIINLEKHNMEGTSLVILNVRIKANKTKGIKHEDRLLIFPWSMIKRYERFSTDLIKKMEFVAGSSVDKEKFYDLSHIKNYFNL